MSRFFYFINCSKFYVSYFIIFALWKSLSEQELHQIAMNHVGKDLEKKGFEFIAINSQLKKHPQFVCVDNAKYLAFCNGSSCSYIQ